MKQQLANEWKFYLQEEPKNDFYNKDLWARDFDDSGWRSVCVPHDWAVSYPFDEKNSSGTAYLRGGIGWYRYHFAVERENRGKHAFLLFDGVYKHCKVWCNGWYVGSWQNGYTSFRLDITEALKTDGSDNVIAVCVEHEDIADSRWYTGSGIMRPVHLLYTGAACLPDDGVFFHTEDNETVRIEAKVQNLLEEPQHVTCTVQLLDADGSTIYEEDKPLAIAAETTEALAYKAVIPHLQLWSPETPSLYQLRVSVLVGDTLSDEYTTAVGVRSLRFDADKGFFCNGNNIKLRGVCLHEDAGCLGSAVPAAVWERRLVKLQAAGCNAIRMSHNPHSDVLYELCDRLGLFVMDELYDEWANPKNKWTHGHNVYPPSHQGITEDFFSCYEKDVRSFVIRRRNHPSVIMWSIGNEIDYPNDPYCSPKFKEMTGNNDASKPAAERQYNPNHPDISQMRRLTRLLVRQVKKWDATRPVTLALAFPELSSQMGVVEQLDVVGYNYKEHLYADDHKRFPAKPFVGSENHHTLSAWKAVTSNDYIAGQFLWTGVDYLGEAHGWPVHGSGAGLLDLAGFEKPRYYQRKAWWSAEPFVKLYTAPAGTEDWQERWHYADGEQITVRAYTNAAEVAFHVAGAAQKTAAAIEEGYAEITLPYTAGVLRAQAAGASDELATADEAQSLQCHVCYGDGVIQLEVRAADAGGAFCPTCDALLAVAVTGDAALLGIENGDLADNTPYAESARRLHNGRALVYLRPLAGRTGQQNARVCMTAGSISTEIPLAW